MKKFFLAVVAGCLLLPVAGFAGWDAWEVRPKYHDAVPGDGFMDPGSQMNPYIIQDRRGTPRYRMKSKFYDTTPGDGFMDPGSQMNPWVIERPPRKRGSRGRW